MFIDNFSESLKLTNHGIRLPEFKLNDEYYDKYNISRDSTNTEILAQIARVGYKEKIKKGLIPKEKAKEYGDRVKYELNAFERTGFTDYILLVFDVIAFARDNNLARGAGRGSAASSLVNYLTGITDIDPVDYGLIFQRFVSENRTKVINVDGVNYITGSCADIDCDFGDEDRDKVIEYVSNKYKGKFVKLSTVGTLTTKILTKELGKIVGNYSEQQMGYITDNIPVVFGKVNAPIKAYDNSEIYKNFMDENPLIFKISKKLYECIKHTSSHASAFNVSFDKLEDYMPCQLGTDGEIISTFDMDTAQNLSVKLDLLGVQTLNLIYGVLSRLKLDINDLDIHNPLIYSVLQDLQHAYGLFQIAGNSVVKGTQKIKPANFDELCDSIAIIRPGSYVFVDEYASVKNGNAASTTCPEEFKDILQQTNYICTYQESLMSLFNKIGFSMEEANEIRQIVSKKKVSEIAQWEPRIFEMGEKNGFSKETCDYLWSLAKNSADYSFPKSHAYSYGSIAAVSLLLKFSYPKEFFVEALMMSQKKQDPYEQIALIAQELPYFNIKLLPPDLIKSGMNFEIEGDNIRFGLGAIKHVSSKSLEKLQQFLDKEKTNKFQVFHAANQTHLNVSILASLIQAGTLLALSENRPKMVLEAQVWSKLSDREKNYCLTNGHKYNFDLVEALQDYLNWNDGKVFKASRLETIRKHTIPYMKIFNLNSKSEPLANYMYESTLLGFSFSQSLKSVFDTGTNNLKNIQELKILDKNSFSATVGKIVEVKQWKAKTTGKDCLKIIIADETGTFNVLMTGDTCKNFLANQILPKEEDLLYAEGNLGEDCLFAKKLEISSEKIYFKVNDLKKEISLI